MTKGWPKAFVIAGVAVLFGGMVAEMLNLETELKFGNVASNPAWVRPAVTGFASLYSGPSRRRGRVRRPRAGDGWMLDACAGAACRTASN